MTTQTIQVPDIGDFKDIPVIEILVKVGDEIVKDQALLILESDKATMEVPSDVIGKVISVDIKIGDKVSFGTPIMKVEVSTQAPAKKEEATASLAPVTPVPQPTPVSVPSAGSYSGVADYACQLLVLGSGPGGYSAAFRGADLGLETILVERYATLGGVCLNVGCIPSKALLHTAAVMEEVKSMSKHGVHFGAPTVDIDALRQHKEGVIGQLTTGLAGMAKARKVKVIRGVGTFLDAHHLQLEETSGTGWDLTGKKQVIHFEKVIIAAGSQSVVLPFLPVDPRIVDSTGALELKSIPKRMLVIGGGIIGLEMATVYSALGSQIDIVELTDGLMAGADRDLVKVWEKMNLSRFHQVMLGTKAASAQAKEDGIWIQFEGPKAPAEMQCYDLVLVAVGRIPNGKKIAASAAGVMVDERGFIPVDNQMRTNVNHIFAIGDIVGQPMLAHKAVHEGHVAAEVAAGEKSYFDVKQIPSVAYTDPEVAWSGLTEEQCKSQGIAYQKGVFPWAASGRAIANGRSEGFTKLIFDETTHRIIGGGIVGTNAGDLIGEVCLAIEMGADQVDIGKTIHPHPTLGESIGLAAEVAHGSCTDLPPQRKK
ncbi:dihydrolipoyl dehydrogenase [Polynucleobacter sp. SHI8]|uniref:dihydrolipoyl dehydrogenase n=1 Tax=unclassified Polynucleobacter TaxID=2640945 RepID=UPI0024934E13|nr:MULTISPECIES: dihydrolipoyl dehydrogenase [unclassified Polynucleobacter]BDW10942.1 dihydrolipoyl dehydrogenase [Polynucleobacter sp. SHI2]BDW13388.1 dihydrolipoyl dehydrogenase [Polynucleobacter sp. SHI8]